MVRRSDNLAVEDLDSGVLGALADAAAVIDARGTVVAVNAEWLALRAAPICWSELPSVGDDYFAHCADLGDSGGAFLAGARGVLDGSQDLASVEESVGAGPDTHWFEVRVTRIPRVHAGLVVNADVTSRRRTETDLAHQATHDPLCDLPNRTLLTERLHAALRRARLGPAGDGADTDTDTGEAGNVVAVMFIDVDRFKLVNDTMGHDAGDVVLREVASRLTAAVRATDTVGRFGGDEFVIVCEVADARQAVGLADRLTDLMRQPVQVQGRDIVMTVSVGIAVSSSAATAETLMRDADSALYEAKERGRGRSALFSPEAARRAQLRVRVEQDLRRALGARQLVLHYQPVIDLSVMRVTGAEALLRWEHPQRGLMQPTEFVPIAEECGLIGRIDRWAIGEACQQLAVWQRRLGRRMTMSVNISGAGAGDPEMVPAVIAALAGSGVDPSSLCLELTESTLMTSPAGTLAVLKELRSLGCYLAVDDFGTGYSSLGALGQLPVEVIKIDRTFVDGLGSEPGDTAIVSSIVSMANALGLHVVAEGVETVAQSTGLLALGCWVAQGFLFAPAMSPERFIRYCDRRRVTPRSGAARGELDLEASGLLNHAGRFDGRRVGHRAHRRMIDEVLCHVGTKTGID